jgi:hypothetical protein
MVSVVVADVPPLGVTVCGLKLQLASAGKPLHAKLTVELGIPVSDTASVTDALCPAAIVTAIGLAETEMPVTVSVCVEDADEENVLLPLNMAVIE